MSLRWWVIVSSISPLILGLLLPLIVLYARSHQLKASTAIEEGWSLKNQLKVSQKHEIFGAMASGIVHDMNNISTVVTCSIDMALFCTNLPDSVRHNLELAKESSQRGTSILMKVLQYSKGASVFEVGDLCSTLVEAQDILKILLPKQIHLAVTLPAAPVRVKFDKTHLFQIVMNLVVNAKDAIGTAKGAITISLTNAAGVAELSVSDTGCGIPDELLPTIFTPLFTTKYEGTGLGLGIVKDGVASMQGEIDVKSAVGKGTTFTLTFPLA